MCAVEALSTLVIGKTLEEIVSDFRGFYRLLANDGQMRWVSNQISEGMCTVRPIVTDFTLFQIGPEKGVIQLATAAILNAVWDMWARAESKVKHYIRCIISPFYFLTSALYARKIPLCKFICSCINIIEAMEHNDL